MFILFASARGMQSLSHNQKKGYSYTKCSENTCAMPIAYCGSATWYKDQYISFSSDRSWTRRSVCMLNVYTMEYTSCSTSGKIGSKIQLLSSWCLFAPCFLQRQDKNHGLIVLFLISIGYKHFPDVDVRAHIWRCMVPQIQIFLIFVDAQVHMWHIKIMAGWK
jgi:hypothetical protein